MEETAYWQMIGLLMSTGLTAEEAREKLYQILLAKGDLEKAQNLRVYQDRVHPVKPADPKAAQSTRESPAPGDNPPRQNNR